MAFIPVGVIGVVAAAAYAAPAVVVFVTEAAANAANPLAKIQYGQKVKDQMDKASDLYHSFPPAVDQYGASGAVSKIIGNDGIERTMVEIPGSINGVNGVYQYIIEPDGVTCYHRLFVPR